MKAGMEKTNKPIRWWPLVGILLLSLAAFLILWSRDVQRQDKVVGSYMISFGTLALFLVWAILFSRFRKGIRYGILTLLVAGLGGTFALFRVRGVTGDLLPILEPRWRQPMVQSSSGPAPSPQDVSKISGGLGEYPQ